MIIVKPDILNSTGYQQMCDGQETGCEVAIHADLAREKVTDFNSKITTKDHRHLWVIVEKVTERVRKIINS